MTIAELIQEFEAEAKTTRRVLERVPSSKLTWTPHVKSMSLGTLAMHLASAPGAISGWPVAGPVRIHPNAAPVHHSHRPNRGSARQWRGTGEGQSPEEIGDAGAGRVMDGRRRQQDAHDDAEGGVLSPTGLLMMVALVRTGAVGVWSCWMPVPGFAPARDPLSMASGLRARLTHR